MKLKYFGTGAAEGIPAIGCTCRVCEYAREHGGKEIRLRTQAFIDDKLLIDFPVDALAFSITHGLDYNKINSILITHSHNDHFLPFNIELLGRGFIPNGRTSGKPLTFYAGKSTLTEINKFNGIYNDFKERVLGVEVLPYTPFEADGYLITPFPAAHSPKTDPFIYRIEKDGKSMLWAHDTGAFTEEMLNAIDNSGRLDLISLDCCGALLNGWTGSHLSLDTCTQTFNELERRGVIDKKTVKVINHFSHNGHATHEDLEKAVKDLGYVVSYDGLEIEF